jgi:hypothetical protein
MNHLIDSLTSFIKLPVAVLGVFIVAGCVHAQVLSQHPAYLGSPDYSNAPCDFFTCAPADATLMTNLNQVRYATFPTNWTMVATNSTTAVLTNAANGSFIISSRHIAGTNLTQMSYPAVVSGQLTPAQPPIAQ